MQRDWGQATNLSCVYGQESAFGQTSYSADKAGMHGFTRALASEVARKGATVNSISPGYVATKMVIAIPREARDPRSSLKSGSDGSVNRKKWRVWWRTLAGEEAECVTDAIIAINDGQHMQ